MAVDYVGIRKLAAGLVQPGSLKQRLSRPNFADGRIGRYGGLGESNPVWRQKFFWDCPGHVGGSEILAPVLEIYWLAAALAALDLVRYAPAVTSGRKMTRRVWGLSVSSALSLAGLLVGCLSPTLPLPPPARPDVSVPSSDGYVRVQGVVPALTLAVVQNRANGFVAGKETGENGKYSVTLLAESGDRLDIWYLDGNDRSPPTTVIVPDAPASGLGGAGGAAQ